MKKLSVKNLIMPYFVVHGKNVKREIKSMPENYQFSVDQLISEIKESKKLGITSFLLFGIPKTKDLSGSESYDDDGIIQQAVRAIKSNISNIIIFTDVCLCEYTSHGHCLIINNLKKTLEIYSKIAVSHARAGADYVAPSGMMKGQVKEIRKALDKNGFKKTKIMGYSAKYASAFYGPFRDAAESAPAFGDRSGYQMDPKGSYKEALKEIAADIREGADIIMVKPALPYLDVIREAKLKFKKPLAAYNVSGEYSMLKAAASYGWIDEKKVLLETMTSIRRAGADIIITYSAKDIAKLI